MFGSVNKALLSLPAFCFGSLLALGQSGQTNIVWDTTVKGHFSKEDVRKKILYVPVSVPEGITGFNMHATISDPKNNVLDMGLFDQRGIQPGPANGFRGWAGGVSSKKVHITKEEATPSYIAGPIGKGIWNVMLVPTSVKQDGFDWELYVGLERSSGLLKSFAAHPAREAINHKEGWYRGDLHMHDVHSDGVYSEAELVQRSKAAGLNFMIPTDHNTNSSNLNWGKYDSDSILIMNGEEVTPFQENHWNAIGVDPYTWIDWRYDAASGRIGQYQQQVHRAGGLCVMNHPFYDNDSIVDTRFPVEGFDAIEVWNGPWDQRDNYGVRWWDRMLQKGIVKTAIGASDSHRPIPGDNSIGQPQTVVHAKGLDRRDIIEGIRKGRCYIAENAGISMTMNIRAMHSKHAATIGDTLFLSRKEELTVHLSVSGVSDSSVVLLISNRGIEHSFDPIHGKADLKYKLPSKGIQYIRAEVRKNDEAMEALTNPVWVRER